MVRKMANEKNVIEKRIKELENNIDYYKEKMMENEYELNFIMKNYEDKKLNPQLRFNKELNLVTENDNNG